MAITNSEMAKYPFLKESANYVKGLGLTINELSRQEDLKNIINRSIERIKQALINGIVKRDEGSVNEVEILSFPLAIFFVSFLRDDFLKRRYSLAEAKRAYKLLKEEENKEKIIKIVKSLFNWEVRIFSNKSESNYDYALNFNCYLINATKFQDNKWKLVNKTMENGEVYLKKDDFIRLITEELSSYIQKIIEKSPKIELPPELINSVEKIEQVLKENKKEADYKLIPIGVISEAYPPCIKNLSSYLLNGKNLSHMGRFALTSFLINIGLDSETVIKLYTSASDFDERLTKYQVEHIAGRKGSGIKYMPPNCKTLKTHGLCLGDDDNCINVRHPLSYYRKMVGILKSKGTVKKNGRKN